MDVKGIAVLVIGLLVAGSVLYIGLWKFLYIDLTMRGWKAAKTNYPRLAEKMNLAFKQAALNHHIGEISGVFNGCQVAVKPDDNAAIEVRFHATPDLFLSSIDPENMNPYQGMVRFDSDNAAFNRFFLTRFANPAIASALREQSSALEFVDLFVKKWARPIQRFDISRNGIACRFKYGGQTYIPTTVLESILPELCSFAQSFEALLPPTDQPAPSQPDAGSAGAPVND
jgi:hypothetical protein